MICELVDMNTQLRVKVLLTLRQNEKRRTPSASILHMS